jgi:hypothetical protein
MLVGRGRILLVMSDGQDKQAPSPLAEVVDDLTPRREAVDWAVAEVGAGRGFEEVLAELLEAGWSAEEAGEIVERARQETRGLRGVETRADVVRRADRQYRRAMTPGWFLGMPTVAAAMRLLYAVGTLLSLRRRGGDRE